MAAFDYTLLFPRTLKFREGERELDEKLVSLSFPDPDEQTATDLFATDGKGQVAGQIALMAHLSGRPEKLIGKLHPEDFDALQERLASYGLPEQTKVEVLADGGLAYTLRKPLGEGGKVTVLTFPDPNERTADDMRVTDDISGYVRQAVTLIAHLSGQSAELIGSMHPLDLNDVSMRLARFTPPGPLTGGTASET